MVQNFDARTEQVATGIYHVTMTTAATEATQNVYWKATSLQTTRLIGQARHTLEDVDQTVRTVNSTAGSLNRLVQATDSSLNASTGVLPALGATVRHLDDSQAQIALEVVPAVKAATLGLNRTADLVGNPALRAGIEDGAGVIPPCYSAHQEEIHSGKKQYQTSKSLP